jgi:putative inorganic carbon (HCO3(-)) transporter
MNITNANKLWWILPPVFIALLISTLLLREPFYTDCAFMVCFGLIAGYLLLFKKDIFISLCIFLIPLSMNINIGGGADLVAPTELMVLILALVAIGFGISRPFYFKKILFHPISILLLLDLSWLLITALTSDISIYSLKRVLARALFLLVFYLLIAQWTVKKENMLKFFFLYALGLIIPIISTEINHAEYNFNPKTVFELCKPFFNEHTVYGACIAFIIPFTLIFAINHKIFGLKKNTGIFLWILLALLVFGEFMAYSRAAWISLGISLLMYIFLKLKMKFYHFMMVLIAASSILLYYKEPLYVMARDNDNVSNRGEIGEHILSVGNLQTDASNMERINRWNCALRMFEDRPVTGFGPGTFQFAYGPYQSVWEMTSISTMAGDKGNAHSEPLTYMAESGLPGLISYLIWMLATVGIAIRAYYRSPDPFIKNLVLAALLGFITFFFHGLVNSFIDQVKMAGLVFGSMAIIVICDIASRLKPVAKVS